MTCRPENIIRPSKGFEYVVHPNGDTADIIRAIMDADAKADQYINRSAVQCLVGRTDQDTFYNVWNFVKSNVRYKSDAPGYEKVKSPGALFHQHGKGDCKSFSIAIAAILRALGYRPAYRFTSYTRRGDFTHVYITVPGRDGQQYIIDSTYKYFNREVQYSRKKDISATGGAAITGAPAVQGGISDVVGVFTLAALVFITYQLVK